VGLTREQNQELAEVLSLSTHLAATLTQPQAFIKMLREERVDALAAWLESAQASGVARTVPICERRIERDRAAVTAALSRKDQQWANRSQITRLKLIKRTILPFDRRPWQLWQRAGDSQHVCMQIKANDFACRTDVLSGLTCHDPGATGYIQHAFTWLERCLLDEDGCPGGEDSRNQAALIDLRPSSTEELLLLLIRGVLLLVLNSKVRGLVPERRWGRVLSLIAGHALVMRFQRRWRTFRH